MPPRPSSHAGAFSPPSIAGSPFPSPLPVIASSTTCHPPSTPTLASHTLPLPAALSLSPGALLSLLASGSLPQTFESVQLSTPSALAPWLDVSPFRRLPTP